MQISLTVIPREPINNTTALVQIMAWHRIGDKSLSEQIVAQFTDPYMRLSHPMN